MITTAIEENNVIPMFTPKPLQEAVDKGNKQPLKGTEYSFLDVKEIYDQAYERRAECGEDAAFKELLAQAVKRDMAYRRQLNARASYKERTTVKSFKNTNTASTQSETETVQKATKR